MSSFCTSRCGTLSNDLTVKHAQRRRLVLASKVAILKNVRLCSSPQTFLLNSGKFKCPGEYKAAIKNKKHKKAKVHSKIVADPLTRLLGFAQILILLDLNRRPLNISARANQQTIFNINQNI